MAITQTQMNPGNGLEELKKQQENIKKYKKQVEKQKSDIEKDIQDVSKKLEETFKLACVLRLDMVADIMDHINPKIARQLDNIADEIEKETWEK